MSKIAFVLVLLTMFLSTLSAESPDSKDDIREAVFRHQMTRWKASMYFLAFGIDRRGEFVPPSTDFMQRFAGQSNVKKTDKPNLVLDDSSVILCIDHVRLKQNSAEVNARFVPQDLTKSASGFYTLELQKNGRWKVIDTSRFKVVPLDQR